MRFKVPRKPFRLDRRFTKRIKFDRCHFS